jgi:hypothetical protein
MSMGPDSRLQRERALSRTARLAPFFLIGPISGPFLAGILFNFRDGRPVLGSLYAVALALYITILPAMAVKLL